MKRWRIPIAVVIPAVAATWSLHSLVKSEAKKKREAAYQSALRAYSENFKPGLTRKEVESQLRTKGTTFTQMCCVGDDRSTYADLVKVGQEDAPWYCSEYDVHVAFEFTAAESHPVWKTYDTDLLKSVRIFRQMGDCL